MNNCTKCNLNYNETIHSCLYTQKLNSLSLRFNSILEQKKINVNKSSSMKSDFLSIKDYFSSNYELIIQDLTNIIDGVSNIDINNTKTEEIEESPASKQTMNLCWMSDSTVQGNEITLVKKTGASYWYVQSEQLLTGPFICKVSVNLLLSVNDYWKHTFGIIKENSNNISQYYMDCILFNSLGYLAKKFSSSGAYKKIFDKWKTGDELIIKRDYDNTILFGLNDENELIEAFTSIIGNFRIVMGFSKNIEGDQFTMNYLTPI